ncbi:hypothetical protein BaRGS_00026689 [Batillaria attramentaria]|uniref:Uncharacterized protein n=1 Tax=Batillaria attramentaria TaxID=370345 RepID=A0ABD0K3X9_9CAEN
MTLGYLVAKACWLSWYENVGLQSSQARPQCRFASVYFRLTCEHESEEKKKVHNKAREAHYNYTTQPPWEVSDSRVGTALSPQFSDTVSYRSVVRTGSESPFEHTRLKCLEAGSE